MLEAKVHGSIRCPYGGRTVSVMTFEQNWETGGLVTAEAVFGIGFSMEAALAAQEESSVQIPTADRGFEEVAD